MSGERASERLRAYKPRTFYDQRGRQETLLLEDALPEIIAVVEDYEKLQMRNLDLLAALASKLSGEGQ